VTYDRPMVLSTNKNNRHDIAEILLKVALNTIKQTNKIIEEDKILDMHIWCTALISAYMMFICLQS
jgi:hypothetical protein